MNTSKTFAFFVLITIPFLVKSQEYDPFTPYSFIKNDTNKTILFSCVSFKEGNASAIRYNFRDPVVMKQQNVATRGSYDRQDEYHLLGWRSETVFSYTNVECDANGVAPNINVTGYKDIDVKHFDVRDFYSDDAHIIWRWDRDATLYYKLTLYSWVPGGDHVYEDGKPYNSNDMCRICKAYKERNSETGEVEMVTNESRYENADGKVIFYFETKEMAAELISKIKKYGKATDPYKGDVNPFVFTLDHKTGKTITLKKEDITFHNDTYTDFTFVNDQKLWIVTIDSTLDSQMEIKIPKTTIRSIPIEFIDKGDFEEHYVTDRGNMVEIRFISTNDGVVDTYSFGEFRRGICRANIGKIDKANGYSGANSVLFYLKDYSAMEELLKKLGKTSIPMEKL
ncbi:hypothetical protein [Fluviicola taffensis]|uniref:Uncharacterized protein n=1 Tax=Fluviicola taffensis (strain DSM 16823 / NCIMB 13979 / RW262) TaxID=755732 RepID=F2I944_FLUTR|nr:hypothetical protein [Fluviicola taffensis]AEA42991.1 hypothetical protein Fluta_0990 [Fluviicola taffensis DSM 16823]